MRLSQATAPNRVRAPGLAVFFLLALVAAGCSTTGPQPKLVLEFYLETAADAGGEKFTLQDTGQVKYRKGEPFLTMANVVDVQPGIVDVPLTDNQVQRTPCVFFSLDREGQRQLEIATVSSNFGKKIFLFAADISGGDPSQYVEKPIAVRPIDQMISSGPLFMFLALPDMRTDQKKFEAYVADLKESVDRYQAKLNK